MPSSWMVNVGCVFVAGIHLSRTWMSGSFESMRWNACVHRLLLFERVLGEWSQNPYQLQRKNPPPPQTWSSEEDWTQDSASCRTASPTHCQLSYSGSQTESLTPQIKLTTLDSRETRPSSTGTAPHNWQSAHKNANFEVTGLTQLGFELKASCTCDACHCTCNKVFKCKVIGSMKG